MHRTTLSRFILFHAHVGPLFVSFFVVDFWVIYLLFSVVILFFFFFFQAEDGIRDKLVTGVQTCALPIWYWTRFRTAYAHRRAPIRRVFWFRSLSRRRSFHLSLSRDRFQEP